MAAPGIHAALVYGALGLMFSSKGADYRAAFQLHANVVFLPLLCLVCVVLCDVIYNSRDMTG